MTVIGWFADHSGLLALRVCVQWPLRTKIGLHESLDENELFTHSVPKETQRRDDCNIM